MIDTCRRLGHLLMHASMVATTLLVTACSLPSTSTPAPVATDSAASGQVTAAASAPSTLSSGRRATVTSLLHQCTSEAPGTAECNRALTEAALLARDLQTSFSDHPAPAKYQPVSEVLTLIRYQVSYYHDLAGCPASPEGKASAECETAVSTVAAAWLTADTLIAIMESGNPMITGNW